MVPRNSTNFPSKILLFGEYLVLKEGNALSFPYHKYSLHKSNQFVPQNKKFFSKIHQYIISNDILKSKLSEGFLEDINRGLNFESNIPVGYGLGSSGALVAAIYQNYFLYQESDLKLLKLELAAIESFFHDKSSGIDPLTSFLNQPILSTPKGIELLENKIFDKFELYDSGQKRNAKEAIQHFNKLVNDNTFSKKLEELKELSNAMIEHWLAGKSIQNELLAYSTIQFQYFRDFIPQNVQTEWEKGLLDGTYYMKLCGAGMGGMYLKWQNHHI